MCEVTRGKRKSCFPSKTGISIFRLIQQGKFMFSFSRTRYIGGVHSSSSFLVSILSLWVVCFFFHITPPLTDRKVSFINVELMVMIFHSSFETGCSNLSFFAVFFLYSSLLPLSHYVELLKI